MTTVVLKSFPYLHHRGNVLIHCLYNFVKWL